MDLLGMNSLRTMGLGAPNPAAAGEGGPALRPPAMLHAGLGWAKKPIVCFSQQRRQV
jgi:hypothetical protein